MARSKQKPAAASGRQKRDPRATSKKAAPAEVEVEIVDESRGLALEDGIAIVTTIILLIAFFMLDYVASAHYGKGLGLFG